MSLGCRAGYLTHSPCSLLKATTGFEQVRLGHTRARDRAGAQRHAMARNELNKNSAVRTMTCGLRLLRHSLPP